MLELQARGCHNINLVTPSHVVAQILAALEIAAGRGLTLPLGLRASGVERSGAPSLTFRGGVGRGGCLPDSFGRRKRQGRRRAPSRPDRRAGKVSPGARGTREVESPGAPGRCGRRRRASPTTRPSLPALQERAPPLPGRPARCTRRSRRDPARRSSPIRPGDGASFPAKPTTKPREDLRLRDDPGAAVRVLEALEAKAL